MKQSYDVPLSLWTVQHY